MSADVSLILYFPYLSQNTMLVFKKFIVSILTLQSRLILRKYKPFVVAVTGSVGKTSTKDAIYTVLKHHGKFARKANKSMNSEIGLPLTIIGVPNAWKDVGGWINNILTGFRLIFIREEYPDTLILEVGADHPGDIRSVAKWLKPDIAVITKVSQTPVHVEFFSSPEEVFEEKASLAEAVKPGGSLVLFADDDKVMSIAERVKDKDIKITSFGMSERATIRSSGEEVVYEPQPAGMKFILEIDGSSVPINIKNVLGRTHIYPLLAAAAVAKAKGMLAEKIIEYLGDYDAPKGRMNLIPGINGSTIIDDSYNSSPDAVLSSLETLKGLQVKGKKIAVLGDMMELGQYSTEEHRKVGPLVKDVASELVTIGVRSRATASEAIKSGMPDTSVQNFMTSEEVIPYISKSVSAGDIVLIKGSQSVLTEKIVQALMKEPEKASELLVRQEDEWLERK